MSKRKAWILVAVLAISGDLFVEFINPPPSLEGLNPGTTFLDSLALVVALVLYVPVLLPRVLIQHFSGLVPYGFAPSGLRWYGSVAFGDALVCLAYWLLFRAVRHVRRFTDRLTTRSSEPALRSGR